jgi:flavin-dependent dehydrogenase
MDEPQHRDVIVIGMGPAGAYAAGALAEDAPRKLGAS